MDTVGQPGLHRAQGWAAAERPCQSQLLQKIGSRLAKGKKIELSRNVKFVCVMFNTMNVVKNYEPS